MTIALLPSYFSQQFILVLAHTDFGPISNELPEKRVQIAVNESIWHWHSLLHIELRVFIFESPVAFPNN